LLKRAFQLDTAVLMRFSQLEPFAAQEEMQVAPSGSELCVQWTTMKGTDATLYGLYPLQQTLLFVCQDSQVWLDLSESPMLRSAAAAATAEVRKILLDNRVS